MKSAVKAKAERKLNKIFLLRTRLFTYLEIIGEQKINQAAAAGKWSAAQIAHHLILTEKLTIAAINKRLQHREKIKNATLMSWIKSNLLNFFLHTKFRFNAPDYMKELPEKSNLDEIKKAFEILDAQWLQLIHEIQVELIQQNIFKHPFAGPMNFLQALDFISSHFKRHLSQVQNIEKILIKN